MEGPFHREHLSKQRTDDSSLEPGKKRKRVFSSKEPDKNYGLKVIIFFNFKSITMAM